MLVAKVERKMSCAFQSKTRKKKKRNKNTWYFLLESETRTSIFHQGLIYYNCALNNN